MEFKKSPVAASRILGTFAMVCVLLVVVYQGVSCGRSDEKQSSTTSRAGSGETFTLATQLSEAFEAAAGKVSPSVVPIFAEQVIEQSFGYAAPDELFRRFFGDDFFKRFFGTPPKTEKNQQQGTIRSLGSGVIISADGYILTNNHVVENADKLIIVMDNNKKYEAKTVGTDVNSDLAVIKIDGKDLPTAALGNSDEVKVGQWVIAVGNPFQLMHTVTAGIISAKGRSSIGLAAYEDFMQTDASINPGNSGGALADLDGKVVGISTAIVGPSGGNVGIGFAIPINMAKGIMDELITKGKVSRGYLGILPQDIDESLAEAMNLKSTEGALVGDVTAGGPAEKAGMLRGDVITAMDGASITNSTDLRLKVAEAAPGTKVKFTVIRGGKEKAIEVKLGERPAEAAEREAPESQRQPREEMLDKLGLAVQDLTPDIARQLGYENERGVIVANVVPTSSADEAGLQRGDLIREVDRTAVASVKEFEKAISKAKSGDSVVLLIMRGGNTFYVALKLK